MLLGKRPRPAMRRTTSLKEISFDLGTAEEPQRLPGNNPQQQQQQQQRHHQRPAPSAVASTRRQQQQLRQNPHHGGDGQPLQYPYQPQRVWSMVSPRNPRRNSGDFSAVEHAAFLRVCGLCNRQLGPGKDTYMYRGEIAFCSLECRQQQMNQDQRKEKYCSLASMKKEPAGPPAAVAPEGAVDGETVAAA